MMALISELNRGGTAIVIITHTPWLVAEYARRAVLMRKGRKLFDGPVRDLFAREELLQERLLQGARRDRSVAPLRNRRADRR